MKKVLAMSILTMIVMSMGGCGASSDSSSSQDVSSKAETESNSPYTVEADFSKGASNDFSISAGWSNGDPFNCSWSEDNVTFNDGKMQLTIDSMGDSEAYRGGEYRSKENYGYGLYEVSMKAIKNDGVVSSFFTYTGPPLDEGVGVADGPHVAHLVLHEAVLERRQGLVKRIGVEFETRFRSEDHRLVGFHLHVLRQVARRGERNAAHEQTPYIG